MKPASLTTIDSALVDKAVALWAKGQLVAFPTETVYGLGADATNSDAVASIYTLKTRPRFNPLIVHVASVDTAKTYGIWNHAAEVLAHHFWPGPLTLVLKREPQSKVSDLVTAGGDTVAVRIPAHPIALTLLHAWGGGIAAPSANRSGRVSPTLSAHVRAEFGDAVPLILDGGMCDIGLESTVLNVSGDTVEILRPGSVTRSMLLPLVEKNRFELHSPSPIPHSPFLSPGQLESHYAPSIPVRLNATHVAAAEALIAFGPDPLPGALCTINLSEKGDLVEAATHLFATLRALDDPRYPCIAVMPIPNEGIGEAMNDRLKRAAS